MAARSFDRRSADAPRKRRSRSESAGWSRVQSELQAVLDSVDNAVLLLDAGGRVRSANAQFSQWMGIEPAEWGGLKDLEALAARIAGQFRDPQEFRTGWRAIQQGEEAVWDELELLQPEHRALERLSRPLFGAQGECTGRLEVYRDITDDRLLHSKLVQTEKMAALGQLVSGIAHELNNPLTSIMGYAQLALGRAPVAGNPSDTSGDARRIFEEAQRAHRIVKNLLVFARETKPEREPVQLNEVVERTLALRSYELKVKNIRVQLDLQSDMPRVSGDANQLQQVVLNLLVNAEQAVESYAAQGRYGAAPGQIGIRTRQADDRIVLEVCDDGPGIAPEIAVRVFDPFFTTKPVGVGTGLGLSIVYGIVREHGGEISVGNGRAGSSWRTVFTVELPLLSMPRPELAATTHGGQKGAWAEEAQRPAVQRRVLIVEDEPTVARLINDVLREEGLEPETALGGHNGLDRVLAAPSPGYDLIICDLKMPGLDGPGLYRELVRRHHPAKDRILFITGDTLSRRTLEFLEKHKATFLAKPFLADELRLAVQRRLDARAEVQSQR